VSRPLPPRVPSAVDAPGGAWTVVVRRGTAAELHAASAESVAAPAVRTVVVNEVTAPALVLGSTQLPELLRPEVRAAAEDGTGPAVVRRRSGGGVVPLSPGAQLWVDVVVPVGDAAWDDDATRAARAAGRWWVEALVGTGADPDLVRTDQEALGRPSNDRELGRVVCFAGIGPGEVERCEDAGMWWKTVGFSQRRTRHGAVLQCLVPRAWDHDAVVGALDPRVVGADLVGELRDALLVGASPGVGDAVDELLAAFLVVLGTV
jgi:lipoate-protein ligase A